MARRKKNRIIKPWSIVLSLLTFGFIGFTVASRLVEGMAITQFFFFFIVGIALMTGLSFGFFAPRAAEGFSMALAFLLMVQASWDWLVNDWSDKRSTILIISTILFLLNIFTGDLRVRFARKVAGRQIGLA